MNRPLNFLITALLLAAACSDSPSDPGDGNGNGGGNSKGVPNPGDILRLNTSADPECEEEDYHFGRVVAVTDRAVVVADTANPGGGFSDAEYRTFGEAFDQLAYPVVVENFGEPVDLDENGGRSIIFFTRAVNELTDPEGDSYVGGFFWPGDLFPRQSADGFSGCPISNYAEIFYLVVPDPLGQVSRAFSKDFVARIAVSTIGHEFQHLVNASRRMYVIEENGFQFEETWLNEGLSHVTEELMFFRQAGLGPDMNIDTTTIRQSDQVLDAFNEFAVQNFLRYASYLEEPPPPSSSPLNGDQVSLATRGSIWTFLRYAADRKGSQQGLWFDLGNTRTAGLENLERALGVDPLDWLREWSVAVFADDQAPVEARFTQPSWNFRAVYPAFRDADGKPVFPEFPLQVEPLDDVSEVSVSVGGGTALFVRVGVLAGGQAEVTITSGGSPPPAEVEVSVVNEETGQVTVHSGADAGSIELAGGSGGASYLLIPFHSSPAPSATVSLSLASSGAQPALALAPWASRRAAPAPPGPALTSPWLEFGLKPDAAFHRDLLERAKRELEPLIPFAREVYEERFVRPLDRS